jgi:hypothetical protein
MAASSRMRGAKRERETHDGAKDGQAPQPSSTASGVTDGACLDASASRIPPGGSREKN